MKENKLTTGALDPIVYGAVQSSITTMNGEELKDTLAHVVEVLDARRARHLEKIRDAIAAALQDGFDVSFWRTDVDAVITVDSSDYYCSID